MAAAAATTRSNIRAPRGSAKFRIRPEAAKEPLPAPASDFSQTPNQVLRDIAQRINPGVDQALLLWMIPQTYGGCFEDYDAKKHTACEFREGRWYPIRPRAIDGNQKRIAKELGQSPEAIEKALSKLKNKDDPSQGVIEVLAAGRNSWLIFRPENIPVMFELRQPAERKPAGADDDLHGVNDVEELGPGGQELVSRTYEPVRLAPGKHQKPIPIDVYVTKVIYENKSNIPIEICSAVDKGVLRYTIGGFAANADAAKTFRMSGTSRRNVNGNAGAPVDMKGRKQGDDRNTDTRKGIGISENASVTAQQVADFEQRLTPIFAIAYGKACDPKFAQGIALACAADLQNFVRLVSARFKAAQELENALAAEGELEESGLWLAWAEAVAGGVKRSGMGSGVFLGIAREVVDGAPTPGAKAKPAEAIAETPHALNKRASDSNFEQFKMAFELGGRPVSVSAGLECKSHFVRYDLETQQRIIWDVATRFDTIWREPKYTLAPLKYLKQREWETNPIGERKLASPKRQSAEEKREEEFSAAFRRSREEGWA